MMLLLTNNQRFLVYSSSFISILGIFLNILAVPYNVVFYAVRKSILILISFTCFPKFFVILSRGTKITGITSILLRFQSLSIFFFKIPILFNHLIFLASYNLVPRFRHIYDYCCFLHFIDNNNIWFTFHNVTLYYHAPR